MIDSAAKRKIAIVGGGPSALFIYKRLTENETVNFSITIFESNDMLGGGMPYSHKGAAPEHVTNVSGNEIPFLATSLPEWIQSIPSATLNKYAINADNFNDFKVVPRLLFGEYLRDQFNKLFQRAKSNGIDTTVQYNTTVTDILDIPETNSVRIETNKTDEAIFDIVIICTGHNWPVTFEGKSPGYYDSPYPPSKLQQVFNHPIAIRGSSLTAIDAVRTLARQHGCFKRVKDKIIYELKEEHKDFKIVMHSRQGLLPAIRFHLDNSHLTKDSLLTRAQLQDNMDKNEGFLSLDYVFEYDFKEAIREKSPDFYEQIRSMEMEAFVDFIMSKREAIDPFLLFRGELTQADKSIRNQQSVYWKEMLAVLSFAMNYPAKHFSAEDMLRLRKVLMPLIAVVIAFVPQHSAEELVALQTAGLLELIAVGEKNSIDIHPDGGIVYKYTDDIKSYSKRFHTFIDCTGQPHLSISAFPFQGLVRDGTLSQALLRFRSPTKATELQEEKNNIVETSPGIFYLKVPGIAINDHFQPTDKFGVKNPRIYIMAVPYIGGFNPDYSGLDFCEAASGIIVRSILLQKRD